MRSKTLIVVAVALSVGAGLALFVLRDKEPAAETRARLEFERVADASEVIAEPVAPLAEPPQLPQAATPRSSAVAPIASPKATADDEAKFMVQLRELVETEPARAVAMAREGNLRFPSGPNAAERGWAICKALTNLQQFDAARDEAKVMVRMYPDTSWARDVTKHILINPGTHPAERGYGKTLEAE